MARVLLGVTGGIAAYKACELTRLLVRAGHEVTPILTADAERFVTAHTFEALARREVRSATRPPSPGRFRSAQAWHQRSRGSARRSSSPTAARARPA